MQIMFNVAEAGQPQIKSRSSPKILYPIVSHVCPLNLFFKPVILVRMQLDWVPLRVFFWNWCYVQGKGRETREAAVVRAFLILGLI